MEGTVKFYNRDKRFGFITADDGKEYFFHETGLEPGTNVREDDKVSFVVVEGDKGPKAEQVKLSTGDSAPAEEPVEEAPAEEPVEEEEATKEEAEEEATEEKPAE